MDLLAYLPSPSQGAVSIGPLKLHAYALCIILGVIVAIWLGSRRWVKRGGRSTTVGDVALWAVPFGLVGGRLYHVVTDYELYFGPGKHPIEALYIWNGGLGIWGAIALGALGAWIGCRRKGIPMTAYADAVAPGIALAQALGRWGNWFNQELFGSPTTLPWAVRIQPGRPGTVPGHELYHPTFLYESLWCVLVALLVIWADRRFRLGHGRAFALYVAAYCVGRAWVEHMRIDYAHRILGLRLNDWTALVVFLLAVGYIVVTARLRPGREEIRERDDTAAGAGSEAAAGTGDGAPEAPAGTEDARAEDPAERDPQDGGPGEAKPRDADTGEKNPGEGPADAATSAAPASDAAAAEAGAPDTAAARTATGTPGDDTESGTDPDPEPAPARNRRADT